MVNGGKIVRSGKSNETQGVMESKELAATGLLIQLDLPSKRQSDELGIQAVKPHFGSKGLPLSADCATRRRLITPCVPTKCSHSHFWNQ